jgi:CHAT domain-containing protein
VRGEFLKRLPRTRQEAEAIHHLFPDARQLLGKDAQEATIKQEARKYRYLHFATHGLFRPSAPMLSCIALAQPPQNSDEDGFLSARELFEMDLSADLVVLSACETGRGEKREGEGILGLTWALFVAGAPTQIVSQWEVNDVSTAILMQAFYQNLKAGQKKGIALRNAMKTLRQKPEYRHPYFWAPFFLVGDWN